MDVSLREKGVDLNKAGFFMSSHGIYVSLREKGVDLNSLLRLLLSDNNSSPFVRREWI